MSTLTDAVLAAALNSKHVNLRGRQCTIVHVRQIAAALKANSVVENLDLSYNTLELNAVKTLASGLMQNSKLRHLNLAYTSLGDEGTKLVCDIFDSNSSILHLDLSGNKITSVGASYLSNTLCVNCPLTHLNLYDNSLKDLGAATLFSSPGKLTYLGVSKNKLTNHVIPSICSALRDGKITKIQLHSNKIGDAGCEKLIREGGAVLQVLNLSCNYISTASINRFQATTDIPMLDLASQHSPPITSPVPTVPIPTTSSRPNVVSARGKLSSRATVGVTGSETVTKETFVLPNITTEFVQLQMTLVKKQMELKELEKKSERLKQNIEKDESLLRILATNASKEEVSKQMEELNANIQFLQQQQQQTKEKLNQMQQSCKQLLDSLRGVNLIIAHLELHAKQVWGNKPENTAKLECLKQVQEYTTKACQNPTGIQDISKLKSSSASLSSFK